LKGNPISDNHKDHPDPFLFTDSKIMTGQGRAIVCAVGGNTQLALNRQPGELKIEEQQTDLEKKLEKTSKMISKYAQLAAMLTVATHVVFLIFLIMFSDKTFFSNETLLEVLKIAITAVVLLIVAIPEGLPLAVSIAMALSISKLKGDQILIKNLEAVQTCAMIHDLCIGKTGTITRGELKVEKYQAFKPFTLISHNPDNTYLNLNDHSEDQEMPENMKELIFECILNNTDVRIETNEKEMKYEPKGQALEVGMIRFLIDNEMDIQARFIERNKTQPHKAIFPFDQTLMRKACVRQRYATEYADGYRIYVKGAPEEVIPLCTHTFELDGKEIDFEKDTKQYLLDGVISGDMARNGFKTLSYAYKDITEEEWV
jgi:Ca2+ transporting ATPase